MACLIDTCILIRLANVHDPATLIAVGAIRAMRDWVKCLYVTPQNLVEFRNLATRPKALNGLGLTASETEENGVIFEASFPVLEETPYIYPAWKAIVAALGVIGKQAHDARLVAVCHVHRVTHLLTFNVPHCTRMNSGGPGLVVADPKGV